MKTFLTVAEIEQAINYWRAREASREDGALCSNARLLADAYGQMIYERLQVIETARLQPSQIEAVDFALNSQRLPL